jgi:hypothetical protein
MAVERSDQLIDVLGHEWLDGSEGDFLFVCEAKKSFAGFQVVHGHRFGLLPARGKSMVFGMLCGGERKTSQFNTGCRSMQQRMEQT